VIEQGLLAASQNNERIFEAELHRLKARALLACGAQDGESDAQSLLNQALTTARSQQARSLELRAVKDLVPFWIGQGRHDEALALLSSVHGWLTEGFDTQDLRKQRFYSISCNHEPTHPGDTRNAQRGHMRARWNEY
jgi:predicted ATPase